MTQPNDVEILDARDGGHVFSPGRSAFVRYASAMVFAAPALAARSALDPFLHDELSHVTFFVPERVRGNPEGNGPQDRVAGLRRGVGRLPG